jgi:hypothetical protein
MDESALGESTPLIARGWRVFVVVEKFHGREKPGTSRRHIQYLVLVRSEIMILKDATRQTTKTFKDSSKSSLLIFSPLGKSTGDRGFLTTNST